MFVYFVLLFQSIIASGTHIVAKVVARDVEPLTLMLMRSSMAALGFGVIMKMRRKAVAIEHKDYGRMLSLSFIGILNQFLFLIAIKFTTPSNAALLYATTPAIVLLISAVIGRETIRWQKSIGIVLAFCGVLVIIFERGLYLSSENTMGNLIMFAAVIAWTLYSVLGRPMILKYGAFTTSSLTMIIGAVIFLPFGVFGAARFDYTTLHLAHWGGLLYLALGTSIISYYLWYYALARLEASRVAIFINLQPILTTILAVVLLIERSVGATLLLRGHSFGVIPGA